MGQHGWSERELQRRARHRLAILEHAEEVTGSVAATWRCSGISRQVFYQWKRRFEDEGLEGLRDRSDRPHHSPRATEVEVVGKTVYPHPTYHFGPKEIVMYLKRYHATPSLNLGLADPQTPGDEPIGHVSEL